MKVETSMADILGGNMGSLLFRLFTMFKIAAVCMTNLFTFQGEVCAPNSMKLYTNLADISEKIYPPLLFGVYHRFKKVASRFMSLPQGIRSCIFSIIN